MTPRQYRTAVERLGLNLTSAADFLEIGYRTSRRYAHPARRAPIPRLVVLVLRSAIRMKMSPEMMLDELGD